MSQDQQKVVWSSEQKRLPCSSTISMKPSHRPEMEVTSRRQLQKGLVQGCVTSVDRSIDRRQIHVPLYILNPAIRQLRQNRESSRVPDGLFFLPFHESAAFIIPFCKFYITHCHANGNSHASPVSRTRVPVMPADKKSHEISYV